MGFACISDDEDRSDDAADPLTTPSVTMVVCSGVGGCGKEFPQDQYGSDYRYAQLCAQCMRPEHTPPAGPEEDVAYNPPCSPTPSINFQDHTQPVALHSAGTEEEEVWSENEEEEENSGEQLLDSGHRIGHTVGAILSNVLDTPFPKEAGARLDIEVNGVEQVFVPVVNHQDNISPETGRNILSCFRTLLNFSMDTAMRMQW